MPFLFSKHADALLDVPNLEGHGKDERSRIGSFDGNMPLFPQIETRSRKRHSSSNASVAGDEVSVLSLHSAFQNYPIQENVEMKNQPRSVASSVHQHPQSSLQQYRHESTSSITFSDRSLPIMTSDIESIEQSWVTSQQQLSKQHSSKTLSPRSRGSRSFGSKHSSRRFSTQTYSDKGTSYSSIYKSFCDEQSAKSVASSASKLNDGRRPALPGKAGSRTFSFRSTSTVGTARRYPSSNQNHQHHAPSSTSNTSKTSSISTSLNQLEDISLPQLQAPMNTPIATSFSNCNNVVEGHMVSDAVSMIKNQASKTKSFDPTFQSVTEGYNTRSRTASPKTTSSKTSVKGSSSSGAEDTTVMINNNDQTNRNGRPPLSKSSSTSSSFSNNTTESKLQREMYRLSLELASTLSNLDFTKLEVTKYAKQVEELQEVVRKLEEERETLKTKLQRFEQKAEEKAMRDQIALNIESNSDKVQKNHAPRCVTPLNDAKDKNGENDDTVPDLTFSRDDGEDDADKSPNKSKRQNKTHEQSHLLFPELDESHLTCPDLYSSHALDETIETFKNVQTPSKILDEIEEFCDDDDDDEEDEFPSIALDTSVSLIDPREEVFSDDPFATVYKNDANDMREEKQDETNEKSTNNGTRANAIIPFFRKNDNNGDNKNDELNQSSTTQFTRLFRFASVANNIQSNDNNLNNSTRSVRTTMNSSRLNMFRFRF